MYPEGKQQKLIPYSVIIEVDKNKSTKREKSIFELTIDAFFPSVGLCNYTIVNLKKYYRRKKNHYLNNYGIKARLYDPGGNVI